jgi:hypothetical protein
MSAPGKDIFPAALPKMLSANQIVTTINRAETLGLQLTADWNSGDRRVACRHSKRFECGPMRGSAQKRAPLPLLQAQTHPYSGVARVPIVYEV